MKLETIDGVEAWLARQLSAADWSEGEERVLRCRFALDPWWSEQAPAEQFELALVLRCRDGIAQPTEAIYTAVDSAGAMPVSLRLDQPLRLQPLHIPKPWGQEIWYTGVEQRGVCAIESASGQDVPLTWVLATLSGWLGANNRELVLLKILDPLPAEVWGDLYFELHEEKREVYVVTHVDKEAWPDGTGAIRFGFDPAQLAAYDSPEAFKAAYLASVEAYETVRREIDGILDEQRSLHGIALDAPLAADQVQHWLDSVAPRLRRQESELRSSMDAFTRLKPLRVGDVVKVPLHTPHALQHGVRTVEFQTPVYERRILSFAQKVLTQGHWDTAEAVSLMALQPPAEQPFVLCHKEGGVLVERIVDFDDFEVERWRLEPGSSHELATAAVYAVVMGVEGEVEIAGIGLSAEQACLVPRWREATPMRQRGAAPATILVARPSC